LKLFLDTSALIAASGSRIGAARRITDLATANGWELIATPYVLREIGRNILKFPPPVQDEWHAIRPRLHIRPDVLSSNRPVVFTNPHHHGGFSRANRILPSRSAAYCLLNTEH
jgi:hypothetical protein